MLKLPKPPNRDPRVKIETFSLPADNPRIESAAGALDSAQTLVLGFGPSDLLDRSGDLTRLAELFPRSVIVGCSTAGGILDNQISDEPLQVGVLSFQATRLAVASVPIQSQEQSAEAGSQLANTLRDDELKGVLILSDGLNVNGTGLIAGINQVLPAGVVVTGGLAGDGDRFERTWVIDEGIPKSGFISAVGFYGGQVRLGYGSKGGWDIFGVERRVTRSEGNVLYELDGRPALELYREYLGERAAGLPATALLFPLSLRLGEEEEEVVRTVLAVDETSQSMTFAGDIPQGARVKLMRANFDRLIDGASDAALMTGAELPVDSDMIVIAISCVGRRLVLGERSEEEVESVLDEMPEGVRQIGFYSYGEISPHGDGRCSLHNQTMTLTTITEAL